MTASNKLSQNAEVKLQGEVWQILYTRHKKGIWGQTFPYKKLIEISNRAKDRLELDTLIHEMIHVTCPWLDEYHVEQMATEIANILWEMGYRKPKR